MARKAVLPLILLGLIALGVVSAAHLWGAQGGLYALAGLLGLTALSWSSFDEAGNWADGARVLD